VTSRPGHRSASSAARATRGDPVLDDLTLERVEVELVRGVNQTPAKVRLGEQPGAGRGQSLRRVGRQQQMAAGHDLV